MRKPRHARLDCHPGCSVEAAVSLIDGKWKCVILYRLLEGTLRFGALRRLVAGATPRMLTNQLRDLEADGLVLRQVYPQVPPKVEYSLSPLGLSLEPVLRELRIWGERNAGLFAAAPPAAASHGVAGAGPRRAKGVRLPDSRGHGD